MGFDLNEMDCIEALMSMVNQFDTSNFHAYSKSPLDLFKNPPIDITSKCNQKTIGVVESCDFESLKANSIFPSDEWVNSSLESRF